MDIQSMLAKINEVHSLYLQYCYDLWIQHSVYTWKWWLLLVLLFLPWSLWWSLLDKKRALELAFYSSLILIQVMALDASGVAYGYWYYPIRLAPKFPHLLPIDTSILPVIYTLIFQYNKQWRTFIKSLMIMALSFSFLAEPLLVWLNIYKPLAWKYYYGFPIYIALGIITRLIVEKIKYVQR